MRTCLPLISGQPDCAQAVVHAHPWRQRCRPAVPAASLREAVPLVMSMASALCRCTTRRTIVALVLALFLGAAPDATAQIVSVETTGVTSGALWAVTGTGFDAVAANNSITFTPASGSPVTVAASSSTNVDAQRGIRRISVRVPVGLAVGAASVRIVNTVSGATADVARIEILALTLPSERSAAPGVTGLAVPIVAEGAAAFVAGQARVTFGAGITVRSVSVASPSALVATIDIATTAALGPRTVSVTVPRQSLLLPAGFTVAVPPLPNAPPVVSAGDDAGTTLPAATVQLAGRASDDGRPTGSTLALLWTQVSGPAPGVFADPQAAATSFTAPVAGTYVLSLRASDGELAASDTATVVVAPPPNAAPTVDAGPDRTITLPTSSVVLTGTAADDGLPAGSTLAFTWTKVDGPGTVTFTAPTSATTTATFSAAGAYTIRLAATDSLAVSGDTVVVTVNPEATIENRAPVVTAAGTPTAMTLPTNQAALTGTVSDDGRPSGVLSARWSRASGPLGVVFTNDAALETTATFSQAGTFVLRLTADDGDASASAEVTIVVSPAAPPPPPPTNAAPVVTATASANAITWPTGSVTLDASATDDGLPSGSTLGYTWSKVSGGDATFASVRERTHVGGVRRSGDVCLARPRDGRRPRDPAPTSR